MSPYSVEPQQFCYTSTGVMTVVSTLRLESSDSAKHLPGPLAKPSRSGMRDGLSTPKHINFDTAMSCLGYRTPFRNGSCVMVVHIRMFPLWSNHSFWCVCVLAVDGATCGVCYPM